MTRKIKAVELRRQMDEPGAKVEDFARYMKIVPDESSYFRPKVIYDPAMVDMGDTLQARQRAALALPGFNALVRMLRRGQFELKLLSGYSGPIIVAEGDSWFTYPLLDVVGALNNTYAISHLAAAGDTLEQMLEQDEYLDETQRVQARILLISGGGNDALGGGELKTHLRPFDSMLTPAQHVKSSYAALLDGAIQRFDQIFRRVAREAPGVVAICHGYDYVIPNGGKWLGEPMRQIGIVNPKFQRDIVKAMIDRFALALGRLAARYPHVVFLDIRGTVGDKEWADELHPNPAGFAKVAHKFDGAIKRIAKSSRDIESTARTPGRRRASVVPALPAALRSGLMAPTGLNRGMSLHVGMNKVDPNHYGGEQELFGCHNDAKAMAEIARACGYEPLGVLLDAKAKVKPVQDAIRAAAKDLKRGDIFLLTYAGHGASVADSSGDEIDDGRDETWCLFDRQLLDDELYALWSDFQEGVRVLVVSDSCHSGSVIRSTVNGLVKMAAASALESGLPRPRTLPDAVRRDVNLRHRALYTEVARNLGAAAGASGVFRLGSRRAVDHPLACAVRLLSGCQDNQTSGDGDINGLFTSRLLQVLDRGFRGDYAAFHREIRRRMPTDQTPNHWTIGRKDPAFDAQHPFEI